MAVIIGSLTSRDTVTDDATLKLANSAGVHALTLGGRTFVYVAGPNDDGISSFELGSDGALTNIQNIADDGTLELDRAINFASAMVGGGTYLYVNGAEDDGLSAFRVNADGTLVNVNNVTDNGTLELLGATGHMVTATVGGTSFLIASGYNDDGFSVFRIEASGTLTNTDNETDGGAFELDATVNVATATVGGRTFIFVAGFEDDGVSVFELDAGGNTTFRDSVDDASSPALQLDGAFGVATAAADGATYLIASGAADNGLSVFSVSDLGQLTNVFNIEDSVARGLDSVTGLSSFTLDGETFVVASGQVDGALTLFHLGTGGVLSDVTAIFDNAEVALAGAVFNAFATAGGTPFLIGTGLFDSGLSTFDLGSSNDTLIGTASADLLLGLAGNDLLDGAGGDDRLRGGSGDDTYVVDSGGDEVVEQEDAGTDTVQASLSTSLGEHVENLVLLGGANLDGTGNGLANTLTGNAGANLLRGQGGRDILSGEGGKDDLEGGGGTDQLAGGAKADTLLGGKGRDLMEGNGGADDFVYTKTNQSGTTSGTRDQILGFRGRDDIVLTQIDAVKGERGNQAFELNTNGSFEAGEIRFRDTRAGVIVEMNVDRDARAEMSILVRGSGTLDVNDFEF